jgi:hypothetical protein
MTHSCLTGWSRARRSAVSELAGRGDSAPDLRDHNLIRPPASSQLRELDARRPTVPLNLGDRWQPPMPMLDCCDTDPARTELPSAEGHPSIGTSIPHGLSTA